MNNDNLCNIIQEQAREIKELREEKYKVIADFTGVLFRLSQELARGNTLSEERQKIIKKYYDKYIQIHNEHLGGNND